MHHKRKRTKHARGGCLLCKPNKVLGVNKHCPWSFSKGFGKLKAEFQAAVDLREAAGHNPAP